MKRRIINTSIVIMIIAVMFLLTGCNSKKDETSDINKEYVEISIINDNGSTLNHTGYLILDENIIKLKKVDREDKGSKGAVIVGYPVNENYYFEGINEGKTEIWVVDLFPEEINSIKKYEINVDSDLNAKIVNSPTIEHVNIKCKSINLDDENSQINIADNRVVRSFNIWKNEVNIIGLKEGNTTITVKEQDGTEKEYIVKVDANLNVELEEK